MLEATGDIWEHAKEYDAIVITTNGYVKNNGEAVMGRGIALEAKNFYPWLPRNLAHLLQFGNHVYDFATGSDPKTLITLPVKPAKGPKGEPGWKVKAEIDLIKRSTQELVELANQMPPTSRILMPRPGCGNGGLKWEDVKPVIENYLDDRFTVMEKKKSVALW